MEENQVFTVLDENGKEVVCEILFTFNSEETNKNYIVYTDNTTEEDGSTRIYASIFEPDSEVLELKPIENEREWKVVETILESFQEEANKNN